MWRSEWTCGIVGAVVNGFAGAHESHSYGSKNPEREMLLDISEAMSLIVASTWFCKNDFQKIMYESGGCRTVVDYI